MSENNRNIPPLPQSSDEFWDGEKYTSRVEFKSVCSSHGRNYLSHDGYIDNQDGTISCRYCNWGCTLPGYQKVIDGKIVDLRGDRS